MWQISNHRNEEPLGDLCEFVIEPILKMAIECAEKSIADFDQFWKDFDVKIPGGSLIKDLYVKKGDDLTFQNAFESVVALGPEILKRQFSIFELQNISVVYDSHNVPQYDHPKELKVLFVDYFYERLLGHAEFWRNLGYEDYGRAEFHRRFKNENGLFVCPFCDIDTFSSKPNSYVEHFLPKGAFPFLSCTFRNLASSCNACNVSEEGKGTDVKNPVATPYQLEIGEKVKFLLNNSSFEIERNIDDSIENYIDLLKLRKKYSSDVLFQRAIQSFKLDYQLLRGKPEFEMLDYLKKKGRVHGLFFLSRDILDMDVELNKYFK